jgi:hypothetical protein
MCSPFTTSPPPTTSTVPGNGPYTGVVPEQLREHRRVGDVVDRHPLDVGLALDRRTERGATGPPEAVDGYADSHVSSFRLFAPTVVARTLRAIGGSTAGRCGIPATPPRRQPSKPIAARSPQGGSGHPPMARGPRQVRVNATRRTRG